MHQLKIWNILLSIAILLLGIIVVSVWWGPESSRPPKPPEPTEFTTSVVYVTATSPIAEGSEVTASKIDVWDEYSHEAFSLYLCQPVPGIGPKNRIKVTGVIKSDHYNGCHVVKKILVWNENDDSYLKERQ